MCPYVHCRLITITMTYVQPLSISVPNPNPRVSPIPYHTITLDTLQSQSRIHTFQLLYIVWSYRVNIILLLHVLNVIWIDQDVVHELLKSCWSIGQTKRHYCSFKWFISSLESHLLFITFHNPHQVVYMLKVDLCVNMYLSRRV